MNNLKNTYLIALTIIAFVIGISQFLVQNSISRGSSDSRTINISGRQRMLSQKITKASLAMMSAKDSIQFVSSKDEIKSAFELLSSSHNALQFGDHSMELTEINNSAKIIALFEEVSPYYKSIESAVLTLLEIEHPDQKSLVVFEEALQSILDNEKQFLKLMNSITFAYDSESTNRIKSLSLTEYILFAVAFLLLIAEGLFIFRPAINKIRKYTSHIQDSLSKEEYLNNQSKSIFENVKQGVFLIDQNLMISDLYSKETDEIFETYDLQNTNFLKLMRPRLVKRDLEALEMFADQLFNPDIREAVVNRLNPVEQVEIFPNNDSTSMSPRYIQMTFSRIMRDNKIYRVLVTVLDETENVLMHKKIEESETRNDKNYAQLLAILNIKPDLLNSFLEDSIEALNNVSNKYEIKDYVDFQDLIQFTSEVTHTIKGNSSLIGLDLFATSLHRLEDSIDEIKNKANLEGKHFLKVIYQIAKIIVSLRNMMELQEKIAVIYETRKNEVNELSTSSEKIKQTIVLGLDKMAADNNKQVSLDFPDSTIVLPEEYVSSFRNIATQLIRNSIAHGIEPLEERKVKNKPHVASIKINLTEQANSYALDYADDGKGLDIKKILTKAINNNFIDKAEIPHLLKKDVVDLIFKKDFSTSLSTDKYSGRGQGMTLVKTLIDKHKGSYKIGFKKDQSFRMLISFPKNKTLRTA